MLLSMFSTFYLQPPFAAKLLIFFYLVRRLLTHTFGYLAVSASQTLNNSNLHKLSHRSTPCLFLGYPTSHRGYRCMDLKTNRIFLSRHVVFDESTFPQAQNSLAIPLLTTFWIARTNLPLFSDQFFLTLLQIVQRLRQLRLKHIPLFQLLQLRLLFLKLQFVHHKE